MFTYRGHFTAICGLFKPAQLAIISNIDSAVWGISTLGYGVIAEGIAVIRQSIDIIIRTSKGSDPLRPEFGSNIYRYQDTPMNVAVPNIKREIVQSLAMWEPRIKVMSVTHYFESVSHVIFEITYRVTDEGLIDKIRFDLSGNTTTAPVGEITLQAFFPLNPDALRYRLSLIRNGKQVLPPPPVSGFGSIGELFDWAKTNWFFWGRWFLLTDRVVLYMSSEGVTDATMSISVMNEKRVAANFPSLQIGEKYAVVFKVAGNDVAPAMPEFTNAGAVLTYAQQNWSEFGVWDIEGIPANIAGQFNDEFTDEFFINLPDSLTLVLLSNIPGFTATLNITATGGLSFPPVLPPVDPPGNPDPEPNVEPPILPGAFITSFTGGAARNDYNGGLGLRLKTGNKPIEVSSLGRYVVAGNSGSAVVYITEVHQYNIKAQVSIDLTGKTPGTFAYEPITPVILDPFTEYDLIAVTEPGGNTWHDLGPIVHADFAGSVRGLYVSNNLHYPVTGDTAYVAPNFKAKVLPAVVPVPNFIELHRRDLTYGGGGALEVYHNNVLSIYNAAIVNEIIPFAEGDQLYMWDYYEYFKYIKVVNVTTGETVHESYADVHPAPYGQAYTFNPVAGNRYVIHMITSLENFSGII